MSYNNYKVLNSQKIKQLQEVEELKVKDDIFLIKSNMNFTKQGHLDVVSSIDGLIITMNIKGNISHKSHLSDFTLSLRDNMTALNLIQTEEGINTIEQNTHLQSIHIIYKKEFLEKNLMGTDLYGTIVDYFDKKQAIKNLKTTQSNIKNQIIANDIYNAKYTGALNNIFLESKVLEIFFNEFQELGELESLPDAKVKFSSYDKEAIYHAKDILLNNIQNPPTLFELSKLVKLNEFKLKIGFNKFLKTSPYKLLGEYRMEKAKELLENSDMNVTEISHAVGYKYIHNFSKVFSKKYGVRPKELMKSRKYYY